MYYNQNSPDIYNKKNLLGQYKLSLFMTLFQFLCLQKKYWREFYPPFLGC